MERRSHCTEVAKNVFTGTRKLSPTFQSLFSKCVLTGLKWQNGSVLFLQSLGGGNKSVSRVKGGKSAIFKEEVGRLCSPSTSSSFLNYPQIFFPPCKEDNGERPQKKTRRISRFQVILSSLFFLLFLIHLKIKRGEWEVKVVRRGETDLMSFWQRGELAAASLRSSSSPSPSSPPPLSAGRGKCPHKRASGKRTWGNAPHQIRCDQTCAEGRVWQEEDRLQPLQIDLEKYGCLKYVHIIYQISYIYIRVLFPATAMHITHEHE